MLKKYRARTDISLSVKGAHISFRAVTGGGSVYYTEDEKLQQALESHPKYNKLFTEVPAEKPVVVKKVEPMKQGGVKQVVVSCLEDAKEYLVDTYGISRTKLRSKQNILDAAKAKGVEFMGLEVKG